MEVWNKTALIPELIEKLPRIGDCITIVRLKEDEYGISSTVNAQLEKKEKPLINQVADELAIEQTKLLQKIINVSDNLDKAIMEDYGHAKVLTDILISLYKANDILLKTSNGLVIQEQPKSMFSEFIEEWLKCKTCGKRITSSYDMERNHKNCAWS